MHRAAPRRARRSCVSTCCPLHLATMPASLGLVPRASRACAGTRTRGQACRRASGCLRGRAASRLQAAAQRLDRLDVGFFSEVRTQSCIPATRARSSSRTSRCTSRARSAGAPAGPEAHLHRARLAQVHDQDVAASAGHAGLQGGRQGRQPVCDLQHRHRGGGQQGSQLPGQRGHRRVELALAGLPCGVAQRFQQRLRSHRHLDGHACLAAQRACCMAGGDSVSGTSVPARPESAAIHGAQGLGAHLSLRALRGVHGRRWQWHGRAG